MGPVAEETAYLGFRIQMILAGSDLKASFLQPTFHGSRKHYASGKEGKLLSILPHLSHL